MSLAIQQRFNTFPSECLEGMESFLALLPVVFEQFVNVIVHTDRQRDTVSFNALIDPEGLGGLLQTSLSRPS